MGKIDESWYNRIEGVPEGLTAGGVVIRNDGEQVLIALAREKEHSEFFYVHLIILERIRLMHYSAHPSELRVLGSSPHSFHQP